MIKYHNLWYRMRNRMRAVLFCSAILVLYSSFTFPQGLITPDFSIGGEGGKHDGDVFNTPYGVAVDLQGNVWVADTGNNQVYKFQPSGGTFSRLFKSDPTTKYNNKALNQPMGLETDRNDNVWIADTGNHRIVVLDKNGSFLKSYGDFSSGDILFAYPRDIAIWGKVRPTDSRDIIYVLDSGNNRVACYIQLIDVSQPGDLGVLQKCDPNTNGFFTTIDGINTPYGIALREGTSVSEPRLYVADTSNHSIKIFSGFTGEPRTGLPTTDFSFPQDVAVDYALDDEDECVYVVDTHHSLMKAYGEKAYNCIGVKTPSAFWGEWSVAPGGLFTPSKIAVGVVSGTKYLFVIDSGLNRLQGFNIGNIQDKTPPRLVSTFPENGQVIDSQYQFGTIPPVSITLADDAPGFVPDDVQITAEVDGIPFTLGQATFKDSVKNNGRFSKGTFAYTYYPYADGNHNVKIVAKDGAGNEATYEFFFSIDHTPPMINPDSIVCTPRIISFIASSGVTENCTAQITEDNLESWTVSFIHFPASKNYEAEAVRTINGEGNFVNVSWDGKGDQDYNGGTLVPDDDSYLIEIFAEDKAGFTDSVLAGFYTFGRFAIDNTPPTIAGQTTKLDTSYGYAHIFDVFAKIPDRDIFNPKLHFKRVSSLPGYSDTDYQQVPMSFQSDSSGTFAPPGFEESYLTEFVFYPGLYTEFQYYIEAQDGAGNKAFHPSTAPQNFNTAQLAKVASSVVITPKTTSFYISPDNPGDGKNDVLLSSYTVSQDTNITIKVLKETGPAGNTLVPVRTLLNNTPTTAGANHTLFWNGTSDDGFTKAGEGVYRIEFSAPNAQTKFFRVIYDVTPPTFTQFTPDTATISPDSMFFASFQDIALTSSSASSASGVDESSLRATLDTVPATLSTTGSSVILTPATRLQDGSSYVFRVTISDKAGNTVTRSTQPMKVETQSWAQFRKDVLHNATSEEVVDTPLTPAWIAPLGSTASNGLNPILIANNTIYTFSGKSVVALSEQTGTKKWELALSSDISFGLFTPAYENNTLYVPLGSTLYAIQDTGSSGSIKWQKNFNGFFSDGLANSSPLVVGSTIYLSTQEGLYKIVDVGTQGNTTLLYAFPGGGAGFGSYTAPVLVDGKIAFGVNNELVILNPDGSLYWSFTPEAEGAVIADPLVYRDGKLFFMYSLSDFTYGGVSILDVLLKLPVIDTGLGVAPSFSGHAAAYFNNAFVFGTQSGDVIGLSSSGEAVWQSYINSQNPEYIRALLSTKNTLYVLSGNGLRAIDKELGHGYSLPVQGAWFHFAQGHGRLYVAGKALNPTTLQDEDAVIAFSQGVTYASEGGILTFPMSFIGSLKPSFENLALYRHEYVSDQFGRWDSSRPRVTQLNDISLGAGYETYQRNLHLEFQNFATFSESSYTTFLNAVQNGDEGLGWNLIGNPYPFDIYWGVLMRVRDPVTGLTYNLKEAVDNGFIKRDGRLKTYINGKEVNVPLNGRLPAWKGFYIQVSRPLELIMTPADTGFHSVVSTDWGGELELKVVDQHAQVFFGEAPDALSGDDTNHDYPETPPLPEHFVRLYFVHEKTEPGWEHGEQNYTRDIRAPLATGGKATWELEVNTDRLFEEATLSITDFSPIPDNVKVFLVDKDEAKTVDLRSALVYTFNTQEGLRHFQLIVADGALPEIQNIVVTPSVFSPNQDGTKDTAEVSFNATTPTSVEAKIFATGNTAPVKTFTAEVATNNEEVKFTWDGKDEQGSVVSDGNYIVKIIAKTQAGISSVEKQEKIVIDTTAPELQNVYTFNFSPNGDGVQDTAPIFYELSEDADVSLRVFSSSGDLLKTLFTNASRKQGENQGIWDGKDEAGNSVPDGRYTLELLAKDDAGNSTSPVPIRVIADTSGVQFSDISISNITKASATISWITSVSTDAQVQYGETESYGLSSTIDRGLSQNHTIVLTGLKGGTTYHFSLTGRSTIGVIGQSPDNIFTTLPPLSGIVKINNDDAYTRLRDVSLSITPVNAQSIDITEVTLSSDGVHFTDFASYSQFLPYTLSEGEDGDRFVYVRIKDAEGEISEVFSDSIILDAAPPTKPQVTAVQLNETQIQLTLMSQDAVGVSHYILYRSDQPISDASTATVLSNNAPSNYSDSTGQLGKTYYYAAQSVDVSANVSPLSNSVSVYFKRMSCPNPSQSNIPIKSFLKTKTWTSGTPNPSIFDGVQNFEPPAGLTLRRTFRTVLSSPQPGILGVNRLVKFKNKLYASMSNPYSSIPVASAIYVFNGTSWSLAFTTPGNVGITSLAAFGSALFIGTGASADPALPMAAIYSSDGETLSSTPFISEAKGWAYFQVYNNVLYAFDTDQTWASYKTVWSPRGSLPFRYVRAVGTFGPKLYVATLDNALWAYDDTQFSWTYLTTLPSSNVPVGFAQANNTLYIADADGKIFKRVNDSTWVQTISFEKNGALQYFGVVGGSFYAYDGRSLYQCASGCDEGLDHWSHYSDFSSLPTIRDFSSFSGKLYLALGGDVLEYDGSYTSNGEFTSLFDSGSTRTRWKQIFWGMNVSLESAITLQTNAHNNIPVEFSSPHADACSFDIPSTGQYLDWKANLATTNLVSTPLLSEVMVSYAIPPEDVADLYATRGDQQVNLGWTNPSDISGLFIVRKINASFFTTAPEDGALYTMGDLIDDAQVVLVTDSAPTQFTDSGLINGTSYAYKVFTKNADGVYSYGAFASATPADTYAPGPVTNLEAVPENQQITLSWTNPTDSDFAGVKILRKSGFSCPSGHDDPDATVVYDLGEETFLDTGLTNGVTYCYALFTHDDVPNYTYSGNISATPSIQPPSAPQNLTAIPMNNGIALNWQPPQNVGSGLLQYNLFRGQDVGTQNLLEDHFTQADDTPPNSDTWFVMPLGPETQTVVLNNTLRISNPETFAFAGARLDSKTIGDSSLKLTVEGKLRVETGGVAFIGLTDISGLVVFGPSTGSSLFPQSGLGVALTSKGTTVVDASPYDFQEHVYAITYASGKIQFWIDGIQKATLNQTLNSPHVVLYGISQTDGVTFDDVVLHANGISYAFLLSVNAQETTSTDTKGQSGTSYFYKITAVDTAHREGLASNVAGPVIFPSISLPTITDLTAELTTPFGVKLTWTAQDNVGVDKYELYRAEQEITNDNFAQTQKVDTLTPDKTSMVDLSVQTGKTYYYVIVSTDASGNRSPLSNNATITMPQGGVLVVHLTNPARPEELTIRKGDDYMITASTTPGLPFVPCILFNPMSNQSIGQSFNLQKGNDTEYDIIQTLTNTADSFGFEAVKLQAACFTPGVSGSAKLSDEMLTLSDTQPPTTITDLQAVLSGSREPGAGNRVQLTWSGATDNVGVVRYKILRIENEAITNFNKLLATILTNTLTSNTRNYLDETVDEGKTYYYAVTSFDAAGNESALSNSPFVIVPSGQVDTASPVISNVVPPDNTFVNSIKPLISANVTDVDSGVNAQKVFVKVDETLLQATYDALTQKVTVTFLESQTLTEGAHTLKITAFDATGNSSSSETSFTVDVTAPVISITYPINGSFVNTKPFNVTATLTDTLSGIDTSTTVLKADGVSYPYTYDETTGTLTYSWPGDITDGAHEVTIDVKDRAGNSAMQAKSVFTVDTVSPQVSNVSDVPDPFSPGNSFGVKDATTITANIFDVNPDTWSLSVTNPQNATVASTTGTGTDISYLWNGTDLTGATVQDGLYNYTVTAKDKAGNVSGGSQLTEQMVLQDDFNGTTIDTSKWTVSNQDSGLSVTQSNGKLRVSGQPTQAGGSPIGNGVASYTSADSSKNFTLTFDVDLSASQVSAGASVSANVFFGNPGIGSGALLQYYYHPGGQYEARFFGQSYPLTYPYGTITLSYNAGEKKLSLFCNGQKKTDVNVELTDGVFSFLAAGGGTQDVVDVRYDNFVLKQESVTGGTTSGTITVDNTSPNAILEILGIQHTQNGNLFVSGNTQLTIQGNDPVVNGVSAGIEKTQYAVDQQETLQNYATPFTLTGGAHILRYGAIDNAGNFTNPQGFTQLVVDATPPVTTLSPAPQIFTKTKTFTLSANDPLVAALASGVREIQYSVDGSAFTNYASGITLSDGYHTVEYFAVDNVGNVEQHHVVTFTVDTTKPEVTNISDAPDPFSPGNSAGVKDTNTISASITDANPDTWKLQVFDAVNNPVQNLSGTGSFITQLWNGSLSTGGTAPDGLYSYSLLATDKAGNTNKEGAVGGTTTNVLLQDDFNDGVIDPAKWDTNMLPSDPGLTVTEENGTLRIYGNPQAQNTGDNATGVAGLVQGDGTKKLSVSVDVDVSNSQVPQNGQPVVSLVLLGNPSTDALITMNVVVENGVYVLMYQTFSGQQGMLGSIPAQGNVKLTYDPASSLITIYFNNEQKATVPMTVLDTALTVLAATGSAGSFVDVRFDNVLFTQEETSSTSTVQVADNFDDGVIDTSTWETQGPYRGKNQYTLEEKEGKLVFSGIAQYNDPEFVGAKQTLNSTEDFSVSVFVDLTQSELGASNSGTMPEAVPLAAVALGNEFKIYATLLTQQPAKTYRLFAFSQEAGFITLGDVATGAGQFLVNYNAATKALDVYFNGSKQTTLQTTWAQEQIFVLLGAAGFVGDTVVVKFDNFSVTQGTPSGGGNGAPPMPDGFITVDNTLPFSTLTPSVALFDGKFAPTSASYSVSADDPVVNGANAGVEKMEVAKDNGVFVTYTSALSLDEGKHVIQHKATDNAGNTEEVKTFAVDVDGTAPSTTLTPSASLFNNAYAPLATTYALSATDPVSHEVSSGVLKTVYKIDGGAETQYSTAISLTEGEHTITYFSKDNVLNTETEKTFTVKVDNTAPVTQIVPSAPLYANQYAPVSTTYTFSANDPQTFGVASGVSKIEYTLDGGVTNVYNGNPISLTEGIHTFVFYATDNVGNIEQQKTFTVHVDNTPPVTTASAGDPKFSTADKQYVAANTPITLSASDPTVANVSSGVSSTQYKIDTGNYVVYTGAFTFSEGIHTVMFKSMDNVGNTEEEKTQTYHVDATAPTAQIAYNATNCTDNGKAVVSAQTQFTLTGNDPVASDVSSGVKELRYRINGGAWQTYAAAFTLLGLVQDGEVTIEFVASDNVDNTSSSQSNTVILDTTPPVATILSPQDKSVINNTIAVMGTVTESHFTNGSYTLQYGAGQNPSTFTDISTNSTQNVCTTQSASCEPLSYWNTGALTQSALYTLKLSATDCVGNVATSNVLLRIGEPEFVLTFGTKSHGNPPENGNFNEPSGLALTLATDGTEHTLVSDTHNDRIQVFKESGEFVSAFGQKTQGQPDPGEFKQPSEVAVDTSGNIYVVDAHNDRIQKFDKNYTFLAVYGTHGNALGEFNKPYGVAVDAQGNLYITDENNNRVQKLDANGNALKEWTQVKQTVNEQDVFYSFNKPTGIVMDANGNLYVSDSHNDRIVKFLQDGTLLRIYDATGQTQAPSSYGNHPLKQPIGILLDAAGNLYVADQMNHRVQKFDPWGNRLLNFGTKTQGGGEPTGTFNQTADVLLDGAQKILSVTDIHNHRVQKFAIVIDPPVIAKLVSQKNDDKNAIITDPNLLNVLKVVPYPTPSRGKLSFNLEAEGNVTQITLEVYTINGKRVLTEYLPVQAAPASKGKGKFKAESPSLDAVLSSLPNGVYVYRLQISNGVKTVNKTGKFVVVK